MEGAGALEVQGLRKGFGAVQVLHGVSFSAPHGQFVSLVGPSGCGKTTTLNMIAGFEVPDAGDIRLGGQSIVATPVHRRGLGMVFQSHALFPHMTVVDNVGFGLRMQGVPRAEAARAVEEALALVRLGPFAARYPRELSGGQQQRVGIARALTVRPRLILMDEPLSSLDAKLRRDMQVELRRIQQAVGITAIYVTHDQEEALSLSDLIVVMNGGRIEQIGAPEEIYRRPASLFVAGFIGETSVLEGRVAEAGPGYSRVETAAGAVLAGASPLLSPGSMVRLVVRPDRVRLRAGEDGAGLPGRVGTRAFVGAALRYSVDLPDGTEIRAELPASGEDPPPPGAHVRVEVAPEDWLPFPAAAA